MTTLTPQDITNFWVRLYFGTTKLHELRLSAVDRAYRDFNRTMHGMRAKRTNEGYINLRNFVNEIAGETFTSTFNQHSFDKWHLEKCNELKSEFDKILNYQISYGQAQKWINMTLKYMYAIGPNIIEGVDRNYNYFHIPIDNIIQNKLKQHNINRISTSWSRISDYQTYLEYQIQVRNTFSGQIPLDVEFKLFNE